ncbi:MAG TPA: beta-propeller fold lactonase family protein [Terriglobales bacterium]|nr:beta-propeller fold lactonase family protein [Terriglobales bacterium]
MSFLRAARAALAGQSCLPRILAAVVVIVILAGLSLSCGSSSNAITSPRNHSAYITLPANGSVLLVSITGATGAIQVGGQTPKQQGLSPTGLALSPSEKFLYVVNSFANTISIFNVNSDGTLSLSGAPIPAGFTPNAAAIDPSGQYLLVTNSFFQDAQGSISVFSIDSSSGALTPVGSQVLANANPTSILFTHSGKFVYVTNPTIGAVTGFSFANGVLSLLPGQEPMPSGSGAAALAVDGGDQFLYVANPSASNLPPYATTVGNISGFNIDHDTGALSPMAGSPFTSSTGASGPTAIALAPTGNFVYGATAGSSSSIWCFSITPNTGQLVAASGSPFSLASGGLFALFDPRGNYFYIGTQTGIAGYTYNPNTGAPTAVLGSPFAIGAEPGKMVFTQ